MEIFQDKNNRNEKLPPQKSSEEVSLLMPEKEKKAAALYLYETANRLRAYAEPDAIGVHIKRITLLEKQPEGFETIEPNRADIEMRYEQPKNGTIKAELYLNGDRAIFCPDPNGDIPGIWDVRRRDGSSFLMSHDELFFDALNRFLPDNNKAQAILDQPTVSDSDTFRVITESLLQAGAKRETHEKYAATDFMLQGDMTNDDSFFESTLGSQIVVTHLENAVRYTCRAKEQFAIEDATVEATYQFGLVATNDDKFIIDAKMKAESDTLPDRNLKRMTRYARDNGAPADTFYHVIKSVEEQHFYSER